MRKIQNGNVVWSPDSQHLYTLRTIERASEANQSTLKAFAEWLAETRGLQAATITVRIASACSFVDTVTARTGESCARSFQSLTAEGVEDFFVHYGKNHGMASRRSMSSAMRLFLTFATERGWVGRELAGAVPSLLSYRLSALPRSLSEEQMSALLGSSWEEGRCPRPGSGHHLSVDHLRYAARPGVHLTVWQTLTGARGRSTSPLIRVVRRSTTS